MALLLKGGITWRLLPNDFPPWKTGVIKSARLNKMAEFALIYDHVY
jgi:transposase